MNKVCQKNKKEQHLNTTERLRSRKKTQRNIFKTNPTSSSDSGGSFPQTARVCSRVTLDTASPDLHRLSPSSASLHLLLVHLLSRASCRVFHATRSALITLQRVAPTMHRNTSDACEQQLPPRAPDRHRGHGAPRASPATMTAATRTALHVCRGTRMGGHCNRITQALPPRILR